MAFVIDDLLIAALMTSLIGAASSGLQAKMNADSQSEANRTNKEIQEMANAAQLQQVRETNEFNAAEAEKQRAWEEQMSNTAIQRSMADYSAAGLNPLMAVPGGAAVPSGSSAQGNVAHVGAARVNPVSIDLSGIASAVQSFTNFMLTRKMLGVKEGQLDVNRSRLGISKDFADSYGNQVAARNAQNSAKAAYYRKKVEIMNNALKEYIGNSSYKKNGGFTEL